MSRSYRNPALVGGAILLLLIGAGVAAVLWYVSLEQQRDLHDWQIRLGLVADSRADAVDRWVASQFDALQELADNASLQMYATQLELQPQLQGDHVEPAQLSYLRSLIIATAQRSGFIDPRPLSSVVRANVPGHSDAGLALLDPGGKLLVATPGMPALDKGYQAAAHRAVETGQRTIRDIHLNAGGTPVMGFVVPVYAVQGAKQGDTAHAIAVILGVKNVQSSLYPLIRSHNLLTDQDQTLLVRREGNSLVYLSPLNDSSRPTTRRLALNNPDLAAAYALQHPGAFARLHNYQGTDVLMTSRQLSAAPWVLVQQAGAGPALKESNDHRRFLLTALLLAIFLVAASLVAAWRHGTSVRALTMAEHLRTTSRELEARTALLHAITDNVTDHIYLADAQQQFVFANGSLAQVTGLAGGDFAGKSLTSVLGPETAKRLSDFADQALQDNQPVVVTRSLDLGDGSRVFHCAFIPLAHVSGLDRTVLTVLHDITDLQQAQVKRSALLRQLIITLVRVVDMHDPYSANHSARMAEVALAVGRSMVLSQTELETLELAAHLANLGKIFVPKEILTKTGALTEADQEVLKKHVQYTLDILSGIDFDGPVLETIAQKQEHSDGSGYPKGLMGDQMLLTAKILAVANAFVAMVSPRAYRDAVSVEAALDQLLADSHSRYDRHVVAALFHVAENRSDWSAWPRTQPPGTR
ncbi:MAG: HD domain-containing phosphohydrolase [Gammaproteobacteria bacterium]